MVPAVLFSIVGGADLGFSEAYEAWSPLLFRIVYRMTGSRESAEEIVQAFRAINTHQLPMVTAKQAAA